MSDFFSNEVWLKIEYCCSKIEQGYHTKPFCGRLQNGRDCFQIYFLSLPFIENYSWNNPFCS